MSVAPRKEEARWTVTSVSAVMRVFFLVSWLRSLFSFGLRWCVFWGIGLARIAMGKPFMRSKSVRKRSNVYQDLTEPGLKKVYSVAVSSLSSDDLLKLEEYAQRKTLMHDWAIPKPKNPAVLHYPPEED